MKKECVFCKIIKGDIKQDHLYEDEHTYVLMDIRPASPKGGHCLVMPKKHYELFTDMPEEEVEHLAKTLHKTVKALMKFGEGVNILQNNKLVAGQWVPHVHFHIIPRFEKDGITIEKWTANEYPKGEMTKLAKELKKLFPK